MKVMKKKLKLIIKKSFALKKSIKLKLELG
jgi:hypothetical protein